MAEIEKKPVKIVETILRDAHQSLIATRMTTEQMLPIIEKMDQVGYHAVECWGGATFDASLRFLKEDPWERLRKFRDGLKIQNFRCCSADKIFWGIARTQMM
jgi:oxaloacetate decarboxylase alpha subunit